MIAFPVVIHTMGIIGLIACLKARIFSRAFLYLQLDQSESVERALHFSTVTFTTIGYGDIVLDERWQLLSAFEAATAGLIIGSARSR